MHCPLSVIQVKKRVKWFEHLSDVAANIVRIEVEEVNIHVTWRFVDKNHNACSGIRKLPRVIGTFSEKPLRLRLTRNIIVRGQSDLITILVENF
jgi:hypothetical protein